MPKERLDKVIASQSGLSRKEARSSIWKGEVKVDGRVCLQAEEKIDPEDAKITLKNQPLLYRKYTYIMLNKPAGIISASQGKGEKTVVDLVPPPLWRTGLFPAGRLDKNTVGMIILTDDGAFAHEILSPRSHVEKAYEALVDIPIGPEEMSRFQDGIVLDGKKTAPAGIRVLKEAADEPTRVEIILKEGRYHQIKRMVEALGGKVLFLKRVRMGGLLLDPALPEGACRLLSFAEKERMKEVDL